MTGDRCTPAQLSRHAGRVQRLCAGLGLAAAAGCGTPPPAVAPASPVPLRDVPAEALNPEVQSSNIHQTICTSGYARTVRPSSSFARAVKAQLMREQGLAAAEAGTFELDHRIALALGGHPRNLANLQLQPWGGDAGALRKDALERRLQQLVCTDRLPLETARRAVYFNWQQAYREYVGAH
jgi:hypothetical protein